MKKDSPYWNNLIKKFQPYTPGEQIEDSDIIKLNTNENPFDPPESVMKKIQSNIQGSIRLYPQPTHDKLRQIAAQSWKIDPKEIFVGNGSDEVLSLIFRSFADAQDEVAYLDPTYSLYPVLCQMYKLKPKLILLDDSFTPKISDLTGNYRLTILANPNAPTGIALNRQQIDQIVAKSKGLVIIDEAYIDFGGETAITLIHKHPNLLITRTFSKAYSMAGLRIGFAIGQADLIEALYRIKDSYNVNTISQIAAIAVFENLKDYQTNINMIIWNRDFLLEGMNNLNFQVLPSKANFLFAKHNKISGEILYQKLKEEKILIRHFPMPRINEWIRITVGTMQQNKILLKKLGSILQNNKS